MLISISPVYEYKDTKKTEKLRYKAEFRHCMERQKDWVLMLSFQSCQMLNWWQKYVIDFDKEASSVYTQKGKFGVHELQWTISWMFLVLVEHISGESSLLVRKAKPF